MPLDNTPTQVALDIVLRLGLLGILIYATMTVLWPFLTIFAWSAIVTIALYPVFDWIRTRLGGRGWAAALIVSLLCLAIVFGPAAFLISSVVVSLESIAESIRAGTFALPAPPAALAQIPLIGDNIQATWLLATTNSANFFGQYGHSLLVPGEKLLRVVAGLAGSVLVFAISVIVAGLLFVPGPRLAGHIRMAALDLVGARGARFVDLAGATIRNVARGVIGIAVLQTLVVGSGLIVAEIPHAGLLTVAVLITSLAQVGAGPVVAPMVIWFWLSHAVGPAILFTAYMIMASALEHLLKPIVMGQGLETPMVVILIGVFGGTAAYGLPGLFLGPMILALAYELLAFWGETRAGARKEDADTQDTRGEDGAG